MYSRAWPFGQEGCAYHGFQGMISVLASISFMAAIAWDRYHQYCTSEYSKKNHLYVTETDIKSQNMLVRILKRLDYFVLWAI